MNKYAPVLDTSPIAWTDSKTAYNVPNLLMDYLELLCAQYAQDEQPSTLEKIEAVEKALGKTQQAFGRMVRIAQSGV